MALGKLDRVDARIKRQIARGATADQLRAAREARRAERKAACAPYQKRLNAYHAAWVAAGMPKDFPGMSEWEVANASSLRAMD